VVKDSYGHHWAEEEGIPYRFQDSSSQQPE